MGKILVVEDNEYNAELLIRFLRRSGHRVTLAGDGKQALAAVDAAPPDLILMDLNLPEMDGWEATRRLKSEDATKHIPIIALTAHALTTDVQKAMLAGCDHYETKPVVFARLMKKVEAFLEAK